MCCHASWRAAAALKPGKWGDVRLAPKASEKPARERTVKAVDNLEVVRLAVRDTFDTERIVALHPLAHPRADAGLAPLLVEFGVDVLLTWNQIGLLALDCAMECGSGQSGSILLRALTQDGL